MDAARLGDRDAYAELWRRHKAAALRTAKPLAFSNAEDVVSDAFIAIWQQMQSGAGPQQHFRSYALSTVRNMAVRRYHSESRVHPVAEVESAETVQDGAAMLESAEEQQEVQDAFGSLPERWQQVLWWTEVENLPRSEVAERLSLSPNSVSALTRRAKEGLRIAWLGEALPSPEQQLHPQIQAQLPKFVRGALSGKDRAAVRSHLAGCVQCRTTAAEVKRANHKLGGKAASVAGLILVGGTAEMTRGSTMAAAAALLSRGWQSGLLPKLLAAGSLLVIAGTTVIWGVSANQGEAAAPESGHSEGSTSASEVKPTKQPPVETETPPQTGTDAPEAGPNSGTEDSGGTTTSGGNATTPPVGPAGTFTASPSGSGGIAPSLSGVGAPGSTVTVSVAGLSFSIPVNGDGVWATDLSTLGLGVGSYTAQLTTSESNWSPRAVSVPFTVSAPRVAPASAGVVGSNPIVTLNGLAGAQVCVRLGSGVYQTFGLDAAGTGGGTLSSPWQPGMTVSAGYCTDGRFGPFESFAL